MCSDFVPVNAIDVLGFIGMFHERIMSIQSVMNVKSLINKDF